MNVDSKTQPPVDQVNVDHRSDRVASHNRRPASRGRDAMADGKSKVDLSVASAVAGATDHFLCRCDITPPTNARELSSSGIGYLQPDRIMWGGAMKVSIEFGPVVPN
jgi:hypothetical protein